MSLQAVFDKLNELRNASAVHRKGFRIREATPELVSGYVVIEAGELLEAILRKLPLADQRDEICDVIAAVSHVGLLIGISPEEMVDGAVKKLTSRFNIPTRPVAEVWRLENDTVLAFDPAGEPILSLQGKYKEVKENVFKASSEETKFFHVDKESKRMRHAIKDHW